MNACYETFIHNVLLLLPHDHDVTSIGSYLASSINEFELANEQIIDMILDNLIPSDNDSSHINNLLEAMTIYYKELASNLVDSLGETFNNETIDTSIDISDFLISIEKKYLRFKIEKDITRCHLVNKIESFYIPNYSSELIKLLSYILEKKAYSDILCCYRSLKGIGIENIFTLVSLEEFELHWNSNSSANEREKMMFLAGYAIGYRLQKAMEDTYIRIPEKYHNIIIKFIKSNFLNGDDKKEAKKLDGAIITSEFS